MKVTLLLILSILIAIGRTYGRELTLEQALQLAREHSWQLQKSQAELKSSEELLGAARAERFPTLTGTATASFVDDIPQLQLGLPGLGSITRDLGAKDNYQTDLRLTLPLFTGGRISSAVHQASFGRDYRQALAQVQLDLVLYQTRLDYLNLYRSMKLRDAAQASLKRSEIVQGDIRNGYQAGIADSVDLLEADLSHAKASFAAQQASIDMNTNGLRLAIRLGLPTDETLEPTDTLPDPPLEPLPPGSTIRRAEIAAADASIGLSRAQVSGEKAGYWPSLSVFGGYSYGKPNGDFFNDDWRDYWTAGASLNWSFNLGLKSSSRTRAAKYNLEAARRQRDDVAESVSRDIDLAAQQLRLAHARYLDARQEFEITSQNYRLARTQHRSGVLSSNRLLEIETALTQAESSLAAAKVDFYIAQSGYFFAFGSDQLGKGI